MDFNFDTSSISSILELDPGSNALTITGSTGIILPVGTTAQRGAATGVIRFNGETLYFEGYDGTKWVPFQGTNANLQSLSLLSGTGFLVQTAPGTFSEITIGGTSGNIVVNNGSGTSGNVTVDLATAGTAGSGYVSVTTDTYGRVTSASTTQDWSTITGTPTTVAGYGITDAIVAGGGIVSISAGTYANRPAAGTAGSVYYSTDTNAWYYDNGTTWTLEAPALSGDISTTAGSTVTTLATVNTNIGTFGDASHVGQFTVNGKGLITAATEVLITPAAIGAINVNQLAVANGVATLDANGTLTASQIPVSLLGALQYIGVWNASTNTPDLSALTPEKGDYYKVSVSGNTTLGDTTSWQAGDLVIFNGTTWDGVDGNASEVITVNGKLGVVQLALASADFANQGTTTTFLKGNASGNPSWSSVSLSTDVSGTLQAGQFPALSGDLTTTAGSLVTTLATVNTNVGSFGSGTQIPVITVNEKGLITAVTTASVSAAALSFIGDVTGTGTTGSDTTLTLATVNNDVGTFGTSSKVATVTVNGKGLVTAVTETTVTPAAIGAVANNGTVPSMQSDVYANIPAAGTAGAIFIATDTHIIYRDTGTAWEEIGESSLLYTENAVSPVNSTVTGNNAVSIGSGNTATGAVSLATGESSKATLYGQEAHAAGSFAAAGDAQSSRFVLRNTTSNATETELFLDGTSARIILGNNSAVYYTAYIVARRTDATGSEAAFKLEGLISRDANAASTTLVGSRSRTIVTRPNANWIADVSADTTYGALSFKVTGQAGNTIRWVATVIATEVAQ